MEWLKDPKNQPKVAIGLSVLIVLMLVVIYFVYIKPPSPSQSYDSASTSTEVSQGNNSAPSQPMTEPGSPVAPAAPEVQPAANQVASSKPIEAWRDDPFMPPGYKPSVKKVNPTPPIRDFPFFTLPTGIRKGDVEVQELSQPARRMAGILVNSRVYAIIETNGESEIVQPGDTLKDRLAVVEKIERDKIVLKTKDKKPRYITVRMAASPRGSTGGTDTGNVTRPSARRPGRNSSGPMDSDMDFH